MASLKCKMCGGDLNVLSGTTVCECEYCGSKQTIPSIDSEKKLSLFQRANRLRFGCEFDKAAGVYESIISEFPEEAEAYWGLLLCRYGVEYIDDPISGRKIPTCHRSSFDSVLEDSDFEMVMEYSDAVSRAVYREEAKNIEKLRADIIEVSSKEEPYDIFICYKETDDKGERTTDSVMAQDLYTELTEKGYRVFFSRITLEDKLGEEYEPYIFAALNSSKVMLAIGTDYEFYNAVWVKNEWSRFLSLIEKGQKKTLIPCYKNLDAYDLPPEFKRLQAQDLGKIGATQDLIRGIEKIIGSPKQITDKSVLDKDNKNSIIPEANTLIQRGKIALEDGDFSEAKDCFDRSLDKNPTDGRAYLGKFMALNEISSFSQLGDRVLNLDDSREFKRAEQFAGDLLSKELKKIREANNERAEKALELAEIERQRQEEEAYQKQLEEERLKRQEEALQKRIRDEKTAAIGAGSIIAMISVIVTYAVEHPVKYELWYIGLGAVIVFICSKFKDKMNMQLRYVINSAYYSHIVFLIISFFIPKS